MGPSSKALLFGLAAVVCWSTVATAFKVALLVLEPIQLVFYANLTAVLMLLAIVAARGQIQEIPVTFVSHWRLTFLAGTLNPFAYYLILFKAYELLPAQVAMSINYSWAIVLTFMTVIFLKQQVLLADMIAAFVCYSGVFFIASGGDVTSFFGGYGLRGPQWLHQVSKLTLVCFKMKFGVTRNN